MTSVESRSIYNGPIRRSFDVIQNQTRDLAQVVTDLAATVDELREALAVNAQRLMAVAQPVSWEVTVPANSLGSVTNGLTILTVAGHYYRLAMRLRALTTTPAQGIGVGYADNGFVVGDAWTWIAGNYQGLTHEWLLFGDGGYHTYQGMLRAGSGAVTSSGNDNHFYAEHLGLILPTATQLPAVPLAGDRVEVTPFQ